MHLTPDILEAAYEFVRATPPFKGWHLPPGDQVEFFISRSRTHAADVQDIGGRWRIRVNDRWCGNYASLVKYMMHEMTHMSQGIGCPTEQALHGRDFLARAKAVCRIHHIDPKIF